MSGCLHDVCTYGVYGVSVNGCVCTMCTWLHGLYASIWVWGGYVFMLMDVCVGEYDLCTRVVFSVFACMYLCMNACGYVSVWGYVWYVYMFIGDCEQMRMYLCAHGCEWLCYECTCGCTCECVHGCIMCVCLCMGGCEYMRVSGCV